jgi:hypothetical protein
MINCHVSSDTSTCVLIRQFTSPTISTCVIQGSQGCGIRVEPNAQPLITRSKILNNAGSGIVIVGASAEASIVDNKISGNGACGIEVLGEGKEGALLLGEHGGEDEAQGYGHGEEAWVRDALRKYYEIHNPSKLTELEELVRYYSKGK